MLSVVPAGRVDAEIGDRVMGTLIAVERVDEAACGEATDEGLCTSQAIARGLKDVRGYAEYFGCRISSALPDVVLSDVYGPLSGHDKGPAVMVEMRYLSCDVDPRTSFNVTDSAGIGEACSALTWKCNVIWRPDYDQSSLFYGRLDEAL
jgi:hypothetical protein